MKHCACEAASDVWEIPGNTCDSPLCTFLQEKEERRLEAMNVRPGLLCEDISNGMASSLTMTSAQHEQAPHFTPNAEHFLLFTCLVHSLSTEYSVQPPHLYLSHPFPPSSAQLSVSMAYQERVRIPVFNELDMEPMPNHRSATTIPFHTQKNRYFSADAPHLVQNTVEALKSAAHGGCGLQVCGQDGAVRGGEPDGVGGGLEPEPV
jgi:hypothetical protein